MCKSHASQRFFRTFFVFMLIVSLTACRNGSGDRIVSETEEEGYDGAAEMMALEFRHTKDPSLDRVPRERLETALEQTRLSKLSAQSLISAYGTWTERGPNSDATGPSNGNTRANSGVASGRVRAILVDAGDLTGNTVWAAGVAGGFWKNTDITASPGTWSLVDDFLSNMAITSICQNPANASIMYFCTGEAFFNADAVRGDGIFKSTDHGVTWSQLASTTGTSFDFCSKILCDAAGNVYVSTRSGVFRSTDGGTNWTTITPAGLLSNRISDMELSNTGRLHVSSGIFSTCAYRYTDNPSTVSSATWTAPASGYPASTVRIELGCAGNILYALPSDASTEVPTIYKSTDGGANWSALAVNPTAGWAGSQAWYALGVDIDPSNSNIAVVGGLEPYKTTDGGATWNKIANWVGPIGQYVHADIHFIKLYGTNRILFGCDGGVHFSTDGGTTIRDRNTGLRIKQFFSCAIHPSTTDYFLAGAQDNGFHQFSAAGLGATVEAVGGDGAFVHIDQNEPQYQFGSYVFNQYRRSTNGGVSWSAVNLSGSAGQFINPTDYDDAANIMYCANSAGSFRRWNNPQTGASSNSIIITAFNGNTVNAVKVSPFTSNRVYFGTENDAAGTTLSYVDNANTATTGTAGTLINTGLPTDGSISCVDVGTSDNNLMCSYSNYGFNNVWVSSDGGTTWTNIDGNLPDMPVRWCMFVPGNNSKAIIATETGVWITELINGGSTVWLASPSFPAVRTDMLQYRPSDKLIAAATHGRGLWTQSVLTILPLNNFTLRGRWISGNTTELLWDEPSTADGGIFNIEYSTDGFSFSSCGTANVLQNKTNYNFVHHPVAPQVYYRIKHTNVNGKVLYSNTIHLSGAVTGSDLNINSIYPNPVRSDLNLAFTAAGTGKLLYTITSTSGQAVWRSEEDLRYTGAYIRNFPMQGLKPGTYIMTIRNGSGRVSSRFVKQ